jgi:signal transduction histidine kinase
LVLETQGLEPALESMAEKMAELYEQEVLVAVDAGVVSRLEMGRLGVIFYIVEEAVNNARKHAQAAHVWVRLMPAGEDLAVLEVEDDGVGFDLSSVDAGYENRGSMGLINLKERTELINGYLKIDSQPGRGTRVSVVIPLTDQAAERVRRGQ